MGKTSIASTRAAIFLYDEMVLVRLRILDRGGSVLDKPAWMQHAVFHDVLSFRYPLTTPAWPRVKVRGVPILENLVSAEGCPAAGQITRQLTAL